MVLHFTFHSRFLLPNPTFLPFPFALLPAVPLPTSPFPSRESSRTTRNASVPSSLLRPSLTLFLCLPSQPSPSFLPSFIFASTMPPPTCPPEGECGCNASPLLWPVSLPSFISFLPSLPYLTSAIVSLYKVRLGQILDCCSYVMVISSQTYFSSFFHSFLFPLLTLLPCPYHLFRHSS